MEPLKDYIRENFDNKCITIPWELREYITIEDIVFMSICYHKFKLDGEYMRRIASGEMLNRYNYVSIDECFENYENVILLYLVLYKSQYQNARVTIHTNQSESLLFSNEFLQDCLQYVMEHNFESNLIGDILLHLGLSKPKNDGQAFSNNYLNGNNIKSARNI
jgi:hypothetical protein